MLLVNANDKINNSDVYTISLSYYWLKIIFKVNQFIDNNYIPIYNQLTRMQVSWSVMCQPPGFKVEVL